MMAYLPADAVVSAVGGGSAFAIPLAAVVGVPAYLNGYAAIPLISGLLEMGMSGGAALAFAAAGRGLVHPRRHRGVGPGRRACSSSISRWASAARCWRESSTR